MVAQVEAVAVVVGPGEAGGAVDQMADLEREEEVVVGGTTTMRTMEVPVVVQGVAAAAVGELGGDEEGGRCRPHHHPPDHLLPQMICWTRTFSLVGPSIPSAFQG